MHLINQWAFVVQLNVQSFYQFFSTEAIKGTWLGQSRRNSSHEKLSIDQKIFTIL